ncbi:MAG: DUF3795 domain-containing protein [Planctomycetia bacterium]
MNECTTSAPDVSLVAYCGLYCGACRMYLNDRCPGCCNHEMATWCKVRTCCIKNDLSSCAMCEEFEDPRKCKKFNNFTAKLFGFLFRSDRAACIRQIRELGTHGHAEKMARECRHTIKR